MNNMGLLKGVALIWLHCYFVLLASSVFVEGFPQGDDAEEDVLLWDGMDDGIPYIVGNGECQCGLPITRILGGEVADVLEYPWLALLYSVESSSLKIPYCGGALINSLYVVTASHCVDGMSADRIEVAFYEQNISIPNTNSMFSPGGEHGKNSIPKAIRLPVEEIISHPLYSRATLDNDIALLRLRSEVRLTGDLGVPPICVPTEDATFTQGLTAVVAGYGTISRRRSDEAEEPAGGRQLHKANVRVLSNEFCNRAPYHRGKVTDNMLCADGHGQGPCAGDTGGPLMLKEKTSQRQVMAGIASWSTACDDPTRPGVYTRVPRYESWIRTNSREGEWCRSS